MSLKKVRFYLVSALVAALAIPVLAVPPGTEDEIRERLAPLGAVSRAGDGALPAATAVADAGPLSGEDVYNQFCFACHMAGVSGAPVFGDAASWEPRLAKGIDELYSSTINGIGVMPAKGTCMSCSDDDLKATVDYMVANAE